MGRNPNILSESGGAVPTLEAILGSLRSGEQQEVLVLWSSRGWFQVNRKQPWNPRAFATHLLIEEGQLVFNHLLFSTLG